MLRDQCIAAPAAETTIRRIAGAALLTISGDILLSVIADLLRVTIIIAAMLIAARITVFAAMSAAATVSVTGTTIKKPAE